MKLTKLLLLLALPLAAQPVLTVTPSTNAVKPGDVVTLTYSLANQPLPLAITAFQFDSSDGGKTNVGVPTLVTPGTSAKSFQCAQDSCVVYGINQTTIPNGPFLIKPVTVSAGVIGNITIHLSNLIAVDFLGNVVAFGAGPDIVLNVTPPPNKFDINKDGAVNTSDVLSLIGQIFGSCTTGDLNSDGKCNIQDLQLLINAISPPH